MSLTTDIAGGENRLKWVAAYLVPLVLLFTVAAARSVLAAPVKEAPRAHFGWEVDKTTKQDICTVSSGHGCQAGKESREPGGFAYPGGVAAGKNGDIYVSDTINARVQEFTGAGTFVRMFGWEVNGAKDKELGATQAEKNVCVADEQCVAGKEGSQGGQIRNGFGIAVDQSTGNVVVQDAENARIEIYSQTGAFILALGGEVAKTSKADVCLAGEECQAGAENESEKPQHGAFKFLRSDVVAIGGPTDTLYVGEQHRVQEFDPATGQWRGEISLDAISNDRFSYVTHVAVDNSCAMQEPVLTGVSCEQFDPEDGDLYLVYKENNAQNTIRKFTLANKEVVDGHFPLILNPKEGVLPEIEAISLDQFHHLAVAERNKIFHGSIYGSANANFETEFVTPDTGIAESTFDRASALYAVSPGGREIFAYEPLVVAELTAGPTTPCPANSVEGTDVVFQCELKGLVDPWGVVNTEAWFEWGRTEGLGNATARQPIPVTGKEGEEEPPVPINAQIQGLRPNATFYYRVAAFDAHVMVPEKALTSEIISFSTPLTAPFVVSPTASFIKPNSAVLTHELNPENARTEYFFEYVQGQPGALSAVCPQGIRLSKGACLGVGSTSVLESHVYGDISVVQEAVDLHPASSYDARLFAESENSEKTVRLMALGPEITFTTRPAANPQATTTGASAVSSTSAVVSGQVDPDGAPAVYSFEVGVQAGEATQYGVVSSGPTGSGTEFVGEQAMLTGLQPGGEYAYRIKVTSGLGTAVGATATFKTAGLPVVFAPSLPTFVPIPPTRFPVYKKPEACKHGYARDRRGRCIKAKRRRRRLARHVT